MIYFNNVFQNFCTVRETRQGNNPHAFLEIFRATAETCRWPKEWSLGLLLLQSGRAQAVALSLPTATRCRFAGVHRAIMDGLGLVCLQCIQQRCGVVRTYLHFALLKERLYWLSRDTHTEEECQKWFSRWLTKTPWQGIWNMLKLMARFYWLGIWADVRWWCAPCLDHQLVNQLAIAKVPITM